MPTDILLYGAGGHGKVVLDAINRLGLRAVIADDDMDKTGRNLMGIPIMRMDNINDMKTVHVAIGDNVTRKMIVNKLLNSGWELETVIHPLAVISEHSEIKRGTFLAASVIVGPDTEIGQCTIVNHGAVIDHDCIIGDFCHIAPNSTLGGAVVIGDSVLIGSGSVILPGVCVGDEAIVGAGAVVTCDIDSGKVVVGMPAAEIKQ